MKKTQKSASPVAASKLDIVVLGATGFTGRLTCRYLLRKPELKGHWGIGGRSQEKLDALKKEIGATDVPTFVVDATIPSTVDAVCGKATCVIACAGPFTQVGMPVVEACMRHGTHYVDSTGEFTFVRQVIEKYHDEATKKNITIVPCCGFDCVPADIGNFVVHREAGEALKVVKGYFDLNTAGVSNGTINSVCAVMENMAKEDYSPLSLVAKDAVQPTATPARRGIWFENGRFTGFLISATGDERTVRRSNSLLRSSAVYMQASQGSLLRVVASTLAFYVVGIVLAIGPLRRWLVGRYFSGTGVGPADLTMTRSNFHCSFVGQTISGKQVETTLTAKEDCYTATAVFLGESALSVLALARKKKLKGGVLTPSAAFGDELVHRLRDSGMGIETVIIGGSSSAKKEK
ncbi:hypothetical protein ABB37_01803 [Leptomonas pyrrhocoris]|uniref:Saccharopine dehydrogenase NADP binding domain-containing protein n=1 Tax=Leptomonas pyrrhocoris TaxID=157538 RepID=A0A0M9G9C5_LEPPY|nr:hypothetical protein ABB37_01803 [Leptomonas pyrrhocoris]XP_015663969.1 hypothetical protein ABB37_01803 [Leptomonas pyrrhocoris]XP_015663970.1 hypothetical protein ABB37_01803 [Leptomonas pyrrhocoris]KPA85529.1 hypothetical protein ABB37_01803 [Leptomonas pyrrhocoris]KPA85530.1 hypothetical protein ABB37_01803 [Leptomonas pyrrhocoris]KPA85531.1 hypothetical protein ABB37_01803 [Leptomonas pyrrhocoris]|eukprot:XP_015663968.1 hypothetical protein ABB37_01803 [Leptomonas pyrrhocoris]